MALSEIALASATVAFIVLVVFLVMLIVRLLKTLKKIEPILNEVNHFSVDVNEKMNCVQPLFHTFSNLGECAEAKSRLLKEELAEKQAARKFRMADAARISQDEGGGGILPEIIEGTLLGLNIWKKLKNQK